MALGQAGLGSGGVVEFERRRLAAGLDTGVDLPLDLLQVDRDALRCLDAELDLVRVHPDRLNHDVAGEARRPGRACRLLSVSSRVPAG